MKKTLLIISLFAILGQLPAQVLTGNTSKKFTVGFDLFTDIWMEKPADMKIRAINQGFNVFGTYNFELTESGKHTFSAGIGIRNNQLYSNSQINNIKADTIVFTPITNNYKRSKLHLVYVDFPFEFRFRFDDKWKLGVGFKLGIILDSKTKYYGDITATGPRVLQKNKKVNSLEKYTFGPTLRVGYKWVSLFGYYQPTHIFSRDLGPDLYPISVGITLSPF
jgi:hypothetical protein